MCERNDIKCGNDLNIRLEKIVSECTKKNDIKSDHRIKRSHVNGKPIFAVRERNLLFELQRLNPENNHLVQMYQEKEKYVELTNEKLRSTYEANRIAAAAGDDRKTWKLYKEIVFNQHQQKQDHAITIINGNPTTDSTDSCNEINGYELDDINNP